MHAHAQRALGPGPLHVGHVGRYYTFYEDWALKSRSWAHVEGSGKVCIETVSVEGGENGTVQKGNHCYGKWKLSNSRSPPPCHQIFPSSSYSFIEYLFEMNTMTNVRAFTGRVASIPKKALSKPIQRSTLTRFRETPSDNVAVYTDETLEQVKLSFPQCDPDTSAPASKFNNASLTTAHSTPANLPLPPPRSSPRCPRSAWPSRKRR